MTPSHDTAREAWAAALQRAALQHDPLCAGDARFIDDAPDIDALAEVCSPCPLLDPCRAYAQAARPLGGIWAGRSWAPVSRKKAAS